MFDRNALPCVYANCMFYFSLLFCKESFEPQNFTIHANEVLNEFAKLNEYKYDLQSEEKCIMLSISCTDFSDTIEFDLFSNNMLFCKKRARDTINNVIFTLV
jgi:hypothetical protein